MGFEYLNHPLAFKHVKDQVATMLKGRWGWLKKKIEKCEKQLGNCSKLHYNQLKEVLAQEENVEKVAHMTKNCATRKIASWVG